jgi:hypothetical protein
VGGHHLVAAIAGFGIMAAKFAQNRSARMSMNFKLHRRHHNFKHGNVDFWIM